jgi:hypothetical protein
MKDELENMLEEISKSERNKIIREKGEITILNGFDNQCDGDITPTPFVTIYPSARYAIFHTIYAQKAQSDRDLKPLFEYLTKKSYIANLDFLEQQ